jgi:hypothetical protein
LKPEEVLTLPDYVALIFHKNLPVVLARLVKYYNAPEFRWGRCGKQRGLGLAACIMAAFTLAASLIFTGIAASLPVPVLVRQSDDAGMAVPADPPVRQPFNPYYPPARGGFRGGIR